MQFNSFGDSDSYRAMGKNFAEHIKNGGSIFDYHSQEMMIRPIGSAMYNSLPYLLSNDPVHQVYIMFWQNIFFYILAIYAIIQILKEVVKLETFQSYNVYFLISSFIVSIFYLPALAVKAMDIQGMALFLLGISFLIRLIKQSDEKGTFNYKYFFVYLSLISLAGLLKQSGFVYGFFLSTVSLFFINKSVLVGILRNKLFYFILVMGLWGVWLQFSYVYFHFGDFWFIKKGALDAYDGSKGYPYLGLIAYTLPEKNAYVLRLAPDNSQIIWLLSKLYILFFEYDFSIYKGYMPHLDTQFYMPINSIIASLTGLFVFLAFSVYILFKSNNKIVNFIFIYALLHMSFGLWLHGRIELRMYSVFRILMFISILYSIYTLVSRYFGKTAKSLLIGLFVTLALLVIVIFSVNKIVNQNNDIIAVEKKIAYYQNQLTYHEEQKKFAQEKNIELPFLNFEKLNLINNHKLTRSELIILQDEIYKLQSKIDGNQVLIDHYKKMGR